MEFLTGYQTSGSEVESLEDFQSSPELRMPNLDLISDEKIDELDTPTYSRNMKEIEPMMEYLTPGNGNIYEDFHQASDNYHPESTQLSSKGKEPMSKTTLTDAAPVTAAAGNVTRQEFNQLCREFRDFRKEMEARYNLIHNELCERRRLVSST